MNGIKQGFARWWSNTKTRHRLLVGSVANFWLMGIFGAIGAPGVLGIAALLTGIVLAFAAAAAGTKDD